MRNPRITITLTPAQADLLADLARLPRGDQAGRIRDLAVIGLALTKGAAVAPERSSSPVPTIQQAKASSLVLSPGEAGGVGKRARRP